MLTWEGGVVYSHVGSCGGGGLDACVLLSNKSNAVQKKLNQHRNLIIASSSSSSSSVRSVSLRRNSVTHNTADVFVKSMPVKLPQGQ